MMVNSHPEPMRGPLARVRAAAPGGMLRAVVHLTGADALSAGLGVLIWVVAARQLELAEIGTAAAVISLAALLGNVSTLGLGLALTRYRHVDQAAYPALLGGSLLIATGLGALLAAGTIVLIAPFVLEGQSAAALDPAWLVLMVVGGSWCGILDAVAVAEGDAVAVLLRTGLVSILRVVLLVAVVTSGRAMFVSAAAAVAVSVLPAAWRRRVVLYRALLVRPRVPRTFLTYTLRHYFVTWIFNAPTYLLPIITVSVLGAHVAGSIVLGWSGAFLLSGIGDAAAAALTAEGSRQPTEIGMAHRRIMLFVSPVLVLSVGAALLGADLLPLLFGARFDATAILAFRLFALAAIPYLAVTTAVGRLRVAERTPLLLLIAAGSGILTCAAISWLEPWAGAASPGWAYLAANCAAAVPALAVLFGLWRQNGDLRDTASTVLNPPTSATVRKQGAK